MGLIGMILGLVALVAALIAFAGAVIILIHAFKKAPLQGILCLCVPFYIIYYAFKLYESPSKSKVLMMFFGGWIVAIIAQVLMGFFVVSTMPH